MLCSAAFQKATQKEIKRRKERELRNRPETERTIVRFFPRPPLPISLALRPLLSPPPSRPSLARDLSLPPTPTPRPPPHRTLSLSFSPSLCVLPLLIPHYCCKKKRNIERTADRVPRGRGVGGQQAPGRHRGYHRPAAERRGAHQGTTKLKERERERERERRFFFP